MKNEIINFFFSTGCKIYVKEILSRTIADKEGALKEGDEIMHINGTSLENMSLKEAKKVVESAKDKLDLKIKRSIAKSSALATMKENNLNKMESTQPPIRPPLPSGMCFVYIFWCLFTNSIYSTFCLFTLHIYTLHC